MKTAIYIENGITQLVLTPENDWERLVIKSVSTGNRQCDIKRGSFYECRGGYYMASEYDDESLIIKTSIEVV